MRKRTFILTEKMIKEWKLAATTYLLSLFDFPNNELADLLCQPTALTTRHRCKGYQLFLPEGLTFCAHYLQKGLAKLYSIDPVTAVPKIFYFWEAGSVIFMNPEFWKLLPKGDYYIELVEDSELISINNIYNERKPSYLELVKGFEIAMKERLFLQMDILLLNTKTERLMLFERHFPNLRGRLTQSEIFSFIGVSPSTGRRT